VLINDGWKIQEKKISYHKENVKIVIKTNSTNSYFEVIFNVIPTDNIEYDLKFSSSIIINLMKVIYDEVKDAKVSLDVLFSEAKDVNIDIDKVKSILRKDEFEEKRLCVEDFTKFEVVLNKNVTTKIDVDTKLNFKVNIENMIVDLDSVLDEILNSVYFYYLQYIKLHYSLVNAINSEYVKNNEMFYSKVKSNYVKK
jgi:hypothetical protein